VLLLVTDYFTGIAELQPQYFVYVLGSRRACCHVCRHQQHSETVSGSIYTHYTTAIFRINLMSVDCSLDLILINTSQQYSVFLLAYYH